MENSQDTEDKSENITLDTTEINKSEISDAEKEKFTDVDSKAAVGDSQPTGEEGKKSFGEKVRFGLLILGISIAMFMMSLNTTVIAPGLTVIATDLNAVSSQSWIATAYLVPLNAFQPLAGKFSDIFGRKPIYLFGISFFFIGSLISALSISIGMLIAGRVIQGFGAGGVFSLSYIICTDIAPIHLRPRFQAMLTIIYGLASIVGPLVGGAFVDKANWHWDFWLNIILGGIAFIIIVFFLEMPKSVKETTFIEKLKRVDYLGSILSTSFICCLLLALSWGPIYGWGNAHSVGSFVGAGVAFISLVITEGWIAKEPNLPKRVMLNPSVLLILVYTLFVGLCFIGTLYFGPIYFRSVFGADSTGSGIRLIPYMVCLILGSILSSVLLARFPLLKYYMIAGAVFNVLGFGLFFTVNENSNWGQQACFLMFCGLALGLTQQNCILLIQSCVDVKDIAIATSAFNFVLFFASSMGVAIYQALYIIFLQAQFTHLSPEVLVQAQKVGALSNFLYIRLLPTDVQRVVIHAYAVALHNLFTLPLAFSAIGLILTLFIRNVRYGSANAKRVKEEEV